MVPFAGYDDAGAVPARRHQGTASTYNRSGGLFDVSRTWVRCDLRAPMRPAALKNLVPVDIIDLPVGMQRYAVFTDKRRRPGRPDGRHRALTRRGLPRQPSLHRVRMAAMAGCRPNARRDPGAPACWLRNRSRGHRQSGDARLCCRSGSRPVPRHGHGDMSTRVTPIRGMTSLLWRSSNPSARRIVVPRGGIRVLDACLRPATSAACMASLT